MIRPALLEKWKSGLRGQDHQNPLIPRLSLLQACLLLVTATAARDNRLS